jgi:serine/threonine protein kinase
MNNIVGNQVGKYGLIRLLGQGGMAEVYEAFQPGTERSVAIKVLHGHGNETPESIARFKREARSIAQLRHTNIVQVFDFDIDQNRYYMVMEYIQGGTLSQYLRERGTIPTVEALRIMIQLADALAYAHDHNVIHRDIKPANIMFTDAIRRHPVVTDFGIARILGDPSLTADGRFMGSPAYLSPEVARGQTADARGDIYGLGLTLYEMLAGKLPFVSDGAGDMVAQHLISTMPSPRQINPDVPQSVDIVLSKALAKDRDRRYQSAAEFRLVLQRVLEIVEKQPSVKNGPRTHVVPQDNAPQNSYTTIPLGEMDSGTLPFDSSYESRTRTLPFDEAVPETTQVDEKPRRRMPILVVLILITLLGIGGYAVMNGNQTLAGDNATPTLGQAAVVDDPLTLTSTQTPTSTTTLSPTPEPTNTAILSPTPAVTRDKHNSFIRPTAEPTNTPTITPTVTAPRPTQGSSSSGNATSAPAQPTNAPVDSGGGSGGGGSSGGDTGGSNPVQETVNEVVAPVQETVNQVVAPVNNIVQQILPTICILNC